MPGLLHRPGIESLIQLAREELDRSIALAQKTKSTLQAMTETFLHITMMISQVVVAGQEQTVTSQQITGSVRTIDEASQQINAGILQITESARHLSDGSDRLQERIKKFK